MNPVAGAVLVGGSSRRMGRDKATIEVGGLPLAALVGGTLRAGGCAPVVAVGADVTQADDPFDRWVPDLWPGSGPLGAVVTALEATGTDTLVVACDLPALDAATIASLLAVPAGDDVPLVVVARTDRLQPVVARWSRASLPVLREAFAGGTRSLRAALELLVVVEVDVEVEAVRDVDTPEDLRRVLGDR